MRFLCYSALVILVLLPCILFLLDRILVIRSHILTVKEQKEELLIKMARRTIFTELSDTYRALSKPTFEKAYKDALDNEIACESAERQKQDFEQYLQLLEKGMRLCETCHSKTNLTPVFPASEEPVSMQRIVSHMQDDEK